jgi:hypothetical protein
MNRFLDEIPDFRTRGILRSDTQADGENVEQRAALGTRTTKLVAMIGA